MISALFSKFQNTLVDTDKLYSKNKEEFEKVLLGRYILSFINRTL